MGIYLCIKKFLIVLLIIQKYYFLSDLIVDLSIQKLGNLKNSPTRAELLYNNRNFTKDNILL